MKENIMSNEEILKKFKIRPEDFRDNEIGTYLELDSNLSRLDGLFSSDDLRRIANGMDDLKTFEDWKKQKSAKCLIPKEIEKFLDELIK